MSTRWPAHVRRTPVPRPMLGRPSAGLPFVRPAEERERRAGEDLQVEPGRAVVDVPDVELDALGPAQARAPVDLRPARDPRPHLEPTALALRVALDLIGERGPRPDEAHLAPDDVPELRHLVDREPAQEAADRRDTGVAVVDLQPGSLALGADDHRAQLEEVELLAAFPDAALPVEDGTAVGELDRERRQRKCRARERKPCGRACDVERAVQRVPSAFSQTTGTPERT